MRKKFANVITKLLVLVVLIATSTVGFTVTKASAATDEVSLYSTDCHMIDAAAGWTVNRLITEIRVKNIAFEKKVTMHYYDPYYDKWQDIDAHYEKDLGYGYELWKVDPVFIGDYIRFALKYEVNGQLYWDNNNEKDYFYPDNTTKAY